MTQAELQKLTPDWNWSDLFQGDQPDRAGRHQCASAGFLQGCQRRVQIGTPIDDWKAYLRWHLINATAPELSKDFVNENFKFQRSDPARHEARSSRAGNAWSLRPTETIGEALGKLYVADYFPPEAKGARARAGEQSEGRAGGQIKTLDWMDEPTKQEALKKLAAFTVKIGYPDKWRDYSMLKIDRGPYVSERACAPNNFEVNRDLKKIGKAGRSH